MIKTLLFDFGDVFIDLDKEVPYIEMKKLGIHSFTNEMIETNKQYETGKIGTSEFLNYYHKAFPKKEDVVDLFQIKKVLF